MPHSHTHTNKTCSGNKEQQCAPVPAAADQWARVPRVLLSMSAIKILDLREQWKGCAAPCVHVVRTVVVVVGEKKKPRHDMTIFSAMENGLKKKKER